MRIDKTTASVPFGSLREGDSFLYMGRYFIKTSTLHCLDSDETGFYVNAHTIGTGQEEYFTDTDRVVHTHGVFTHIEG